MPRVTLQDPFGMAFRCDTRQTQTVLRAWFDEILPQIHMTDTHDGREIWPVINVHPMLDQEGNNPDWLTNSRVMGAVHVFQATDGDTGMRALEDLRRRLELELDTLDRMAKRRPEL